MHIYAWIGWEDYLGWVLVMHDIYFVVAIWVTNGGFLFQVTNISRALRVV